jgi:hypothetical protein
MVYYDDDYYDELDNYEECIEPINIVAEECTVKDITQALIETGLVIDSHPRLICSMDKLVYVYGETSEIYSQNEIYFTEQVDEVMVYSDFDKKLNKGSISCRVIASKFKSKGHEALRDCISFEKIVNKALDGFNMFFFVTGECVFFGCRIFDNSVKRDCIISTPIKDEIELEQIQSELFFIAEKENFIDFYNQYVYAITSINSYSDTYDDVIIRKRGMQFSYIDEVDKIGRDIGMDMSKEIERYWQMFETKQELSFSDLMEEVEESLSFIKSNRVNTYEMLFEAEEALRQAEASEAENAKMKQLTLEDFQNEYYTEDEEAKSLLDDPESMIKYLKKRRGL